MRRSASAASAVSYAQLAEDVVLWNAFEAQERGTYIDVGASSPVQDSMTKLFYDRGWSGLNIEPIPAMHRKLVKQRPRDTNLCMAVGAAPGRRTMSVYPLRPGLSTFHAGGGGHETHAARFVELLPVMCAPLDQVLDQHWRRESIDLLKIDVEGSEAEVIATLDLGRWNPRVLVVEATAPLSTRSTHGGWEPRVLAAGYRLARFDGYNRFYVREADTALSARLAAVQSMPATAPGHITFAARARWRTTLGKLGDTAAILADAASSRVAARRLAPAGRPRK